MAVFINPQSAELEVPPEREPQPQQQSESSAKGGSAEEGDEGQQQWHSPSLSRYENVASSVGPSSRPPELGLWEGEGTEHSATFSPPPLSPIASEHPLVASSCFGRAKHFYHHSPLRYFAPFLLLVLYALLGALLFFWLECDNEKRVLSDERAALNRLRDRTLQRLGRAMGTRARQWQEKETWTRSRGILAEFEQELAHTKSPEALEWNYLGALFYVGTVFTTIGYGNITPRTKPGQALSILYAIVGIPLVLAILNQTSKRMTRWLSERWIRYRQSVRFARKRSKRRDRDLEKGGAERPGEEEDREPLESRTIPVWLALSMVSGYVCAIAGIFLLWESRWSYFTSFYFICISCLTIGLGDVVPDHPYMLIFMFIFVIFGLSCVSMLISVIQIKMEEWLYRMLIRMQKEYQKALQNVSDAGERERIVADLLAKEPWYLRELAPLCISDNQKVKLESLAETYERVLRPTNTKCVQTDVAGEMRDMAAGLSEGEKSRRAKHSGDEEWVSALTRSHSVDSVSDATSLPMDPTSFIGQHLHRLAPSPTPPVLCREAQTELDAPKMEEWTEWRDRQTREAAVGTEARSKESRGTQLRPSASNKGTDTGALIEMAERALDPPEWAVGTSRAAQTTQESSRSVQTMFPSEDEEDQQEGVVARHKRLLFSREGRDAMSFETEGTPAESGTQCSPVPVPDVCDIGTQTELSTVDLGAFQSPCQDPEGDDDDEMHFERERSESLAATLGDDPDLEDLLNRAYPERAEKRDLVIQTDDSYLRIARRLDKLRTNRTEINVYCTGAAANSNNKEKPSGARRKSLRFLEPARDMIRDSFRKRSPAIKKQDAGNGGAEGASSAGEGAQAEQRRDTTPPALTPILRRRDSGSSGRVAEFVANHERGIHDPGTPQGRRKARVTVVDEREGRDRERQEEG